jgi:hypothetical protein
MDIEEELRRGPPPLTQHRIFRPDRDEAWLARQSFAEPVRVVLAQTRSDIDDGASGYIMMNAQFEPTGAPAPDPAGAYCVNCRARIWSHDGNTAFTLGIGIDESRSECVNVGMGAFCERCSRLNDNKLARRLGWRRPKRFQRQQRR